jgi:hypothetical protein
MDKNFRKIKILTLIQYFNLDPKEALIAASRSIIDKFVLYMFF